MKTTTIIGGAWYRNFIKPCFICVLTGIGLVSCGDFGVHVRVKPLDMGHYPPTAQEIVIDEWAAEPSRPHINLAKVIATTESDDENLLRARIVEKARSLGAEGVIFGKVDMLEHMGHPRFQSTQSSEIRNSLFSGGPGIGIPMFLSPWSYQQTGAVEKSWTMYLSGTAIRYVASRP